MSKHKSRAPGAGTPAEGAQEGQEGQEGQEVTQREGWTPEMDRVKGEEDSTGEQWAAIGDARRFVLKEGTTFDVKLPGREEVFSATLESREVDKSTSDGMMRQINYGFYRDVDGPVPEGEGNDTNRNWYPIERVLVKKGTFELVKEPSDPMQPRLDQSQTRPPERTSEQRLSDQQSAEQRLAEQQSAERQTQLDDGTQVDRRE